MSLDIYEDSDDDVPYAYNISIVAYADGDVEIVDENDWIADEPHSYLVYDEAVQEFSRLG